MVLFIMINNSDRTNNIVIVRLRNTVVFPAATDANSAQYCSLDNFKKQTCLAVMYTF